MLTSSKLVISLLQIYSDPTSVAHYLSYWGRDELTTISETTHWNDFLEWRMLYFNANLLKFASEDGINIHLALVEIGTNNDLFQSWFSLQTHLCVAISWWAIEKLTAFYIMVDDTWHAQWASYQIRKIADCAYAGNAGNVFPATDFKGNC